MKTQKAALITGANRGIGFEVARQLVGKEFHVFLTARYRAAGKKAVAALQKDGARVSFVALEVSDPESIKRAAQEVAATVDHLDVLVNNAAILEDEHLSVLEIDAELMQKTLTVNTIGPLLGENGYGRTPRAAFRRARRRYDRLACHRSAEKLDRQISARPQSHCVVIELSTR